MILLLDFALIFSEVNLPNISVALSQFKFNYL